MNPGTVVMKQSSHYLCCGDTAGKVNQSTIESTASYLILFSYIIMMLHSILCLTRNGNNPWFQ